MSSIKVNAPEQEQQPINNQSLTYNAVISPLILLTLCTCVLLFPSYYSTDFDVHRNWLAITRHLPLEEWYFDDLQGQTVHTLDYPPLFAYFEALLSNNHITKALEKYGLVEERCFQRLPDTDNTVSDSCVAFHRSTVVVSYAVYIVGCIVASKVVSGAHNNDSVSFIQTQNSVILTALLLLNPGLLFLDHVHFQYNGLLLGILLLSLSYITQAAINQVFVYDIVGAILFAFLLGMKHLYLPLGPLYFVYLLRHYCFVRNIHNSGDAISSSHGNKQRRQCLHIQFSPLRFITLASVTLIMLCIPYIPFFIFTKSPLEQMKQILSRLFPFSRGLVHDYWAGNAWALYLFSSKCLRFLIHRGYMPDMLSKAVLSEDGLPEVTPAVCAVLSVASLVPALLCAFKVGARSLQKPAQSPFFFIHATAYCSLCFFMLGYHVHEKAIMTVIIPLTLLSTLSKDHARLYLRICAFGHFGLFPLLFRSFETLFKVCAYAMHFFLSVLLLENYHNQVPGTRNDAPILQQVDKISLLLIFCVTFYAEAIHHMPLNPFKHLEFLSLMATSVSCAIGLSFCWMSLAKLMFLHSSERSTTNR